MRMDKSLIITSFIFWSLLGKVMAQWLRKYDPDEYDCPDVSSKFLSDVYVPYGIPNRAYETLPDEVLISKSKIPEAGLGVIAQTFIKRYTWLQEFEGLIVPRKHGKVINHWYAWMGLRGGIETHFLDGFDIDTSSWLRFINAARNVDEENVMCVECKGCFYYLTSKDTAPGQELLVYYGDDYAEDTNGRAF